MGKVGTLVVSLGRWADKINGLSQEGCKLMS